MRHRSNKASRSLWRSIEFTSNSKHSRQQSTSSKSNLRHFARNDLSSYEKLLLKGGADKDFRVKYNVAKTKEDFVALAIEDGFEFTVAELEAVLKEEELDFESSGNPRSRAVWLR